MSNILPSGTGWICDPGHAWLCVPLDGPSGDWYAKKMAKAIATASRFSWVARGKCRQQHFAMLEEDCDAPAFITACALSPDEVRALPEHQVEHVKRPWD